jgi:hypothetical protein
MNSDVSASCRIWISWTLPKPRHWRARLSKQATARSGFPRHLGATLLRWRLIC